MLLYITENLDILIFFSVYHFSNIEICEKENRTLNTKSTHTQNGYGLLYD